MLSEERKGGEEFLEFLCFLKVGEKRVCLFFLFFFLMTTGGGLLMRWHEARWSIFVVAGLVEINRLRVFVFGVQRYEFSLLEGREDWGYRI